jgi:hypothetical protein
MSQHPYYARNDDPPYKLRNTIPWVALLLPALSVAWLIHKAVGAPYDNIGYTRRHPPGQP